MYPEKVIVEGLNYAQVVPETLDSEIRLVKFQPTASINDILPGNQVKFLLQGTGFLDPYSTYLRFTVTCPQAVYNPNNLRGMKFVDRSAHSFISRLYITCNGVEVERIEDYDVLAGIIGDSLYSSEQNQFHGFEGFPCQTFTHSRDVCIPQSIVGASGGQYGPQNPMSAVSASRNALYSDFYRRTLTMLLSGNSASTNTFTKVGEPAFYLPQVATGTVTENTLTSTDVSIVGGMNLNGIGGDHTVHFPGQYYSDNVTPASDMLTYDYIENGQCLAQVRYVETTPGGTYTAALVGQTELQFTIPLYSSIIGVLMPQKRLIPLHVLPLDIELTMSQYALYSSDALTSRQYTISRMELFSHVLFFYNDIPKTVDSMVAESGIFFHMSSFYRAPLTVIVGKSLPGVAQIQMNFNAINSVHFAFLYQNYASNNYQRKLHFVSHNIEQLQIQNGTFQVPNEPIQPIGLANPNSGNGRNNAYAPYLVEYLKSWNKLHDPSVDVGLYGQNVCNDRLGCQALPYNTTIFDAFLESQAITQLKATTGIEGILSSRTQIGTRPFSLAEQLVLELVQKQSNVGRASYGISLEGEQLGEIKTAITGRKAVLPFNIALTGQKAETITSEMYIFLRHDAILTINPNLAVQLTR